MIVNRSQDDFRVNSLLPHLCPQGQCVRHQVVHQAWASLRVAMDGGKGSLFHDGGGTSRTGDLVEDILCHFRIRQSGKVVVHGDPLAKGFVDGLAESVVQMGFPAQDESKTVEGIVPIIHEHLDALHEAFCQVLFLVIDAKLFNAAGYGQEERAQNAPVDV